jgi:hypothetical protein
MITIDASGGLSIPKAIFILSSLFFLTSLDYIIFHPHSFQLLCLELLLYFVEPLT